MASDSATDGTVLTQYTDPMCTWCWGSEPIRRHLQVAYGDQVRMEYVMGGLVEDFEDFYDAKNDIAEPADVAPHWEEASRHHGMPVDTEIFQADPAQSTYPASVAFAAAREQGAELAHRYLRRLREAYATEVRNVNRREEQLALAESVGLDVARFETAIEDGTARETFERDLERSRSAGIRSFPTYDVVGPEGARRLAGFQSFEDLSSALAAVDPSLERSSPPPVRRFVADYGPVATQEVAEVYEIPPGEARQVLQSLADDDGIRREQRGNGLFWDATGGAE